VTIDHNVEPEYDVPLWSETRWNACWNPEQGVGLYLHMGRFRRNLDYWWAQVVAYLPDSQLCVTRLWGRNGSSAGVALGPYSLEMTEDGWTTTMDGIGELTTIRGLADGVRGDSAPSRVMQWEMTATPVTAPYDLHPAEVDERLTNAFSRAHAEQGFATQGWLKVDGREYRLDGHGFKDHSCGIRDFRPWHSHNFLMVMSPESTTHLIMMAAPDGEWLPPMGAVVGRDGTTDPITHLEFPRLADAVGGPIISRLEYSTASGASFGYDVELIHACPITITEDNDNINGVDWQIDGDPVIVVEGIGRATDADGRVLSCFHERALRRSLLKPLD
jgi:hypothetical protein